MKKNWKVIKICCYEKANFKRLERYLKISSIEYIRKQVDSYTNLFAVRNDDIITALGLIQRFVSKDEAFTYRHIVVINDVGANYIEISINDVWDY